MVFYNPYDLFIGEFPVIFSFRLEEGMITPTFRKSNFMFTTSEKFYFLESFQVFSDKILYARAIKKDQLHNEVVVFNSDKEFEDIDWLEGKKELELLSVLAVPGYNTTTNPFCVGVSTDHSKLKLVNTVTRVVLDIAVLKKNHPADAIDFL